MTASLKLPVENGNLVNNVLIGYYLQLRKDYKVLLNMDRVQIFTRQSLIAPASAMDNRFPQYFEQLFLNL